MKYKAKESYAKLSLDKTYYNMGSPAKHENLLKGQWVEITSPPESLLKHLQLEEKITRKKGNK
jgi:hypothetical protein|tara:strand:- start:516 stop:704 length:189 start_codon:yes stop_codon:yes gene_type:complete